MSAERSPATTCGAPDEQELLIITDDHHHGRTGLALPFAQATVVEAPADPKDLEISGCFDGLIVDRHAFDLDWLDEVTGRALPALRPGWWMTVAFDPTGVPSPARHGGQSNLRRLCWRGLTTVNGRTCAVLGDGPSGYGTGVVGESAVDGLSDGMAPLLLATADTALRLAYGELPRGSEGLVGSAAVGLASLAEAELILREHLEDRRRSEHALIGHLDVLTVELEKARVTAQRLRQPSMLARAVLRQSAPGRVLLGVLRRGRRLARKVRPPGNRRS